MDISGKGLSPRVRGNPGMRPRRPQHGGSIPACAGEPHLPLCLCASGKVYPRVCGGTAHRPPEIRAGAGLSPRVRGNRHRRRTASENRRSIPACAGEPLTGLFGMMTWEVYPRVCGGTAGDGAAHYDEYGLSPRVRGNLAFHPGILIDAGSIPACAGEPSPPATCTRAWKVYPRVCGGTSDSFSDLLPRAGLSPRVRGNRRWASPSPAWARSIPACAGEPAGGGESSGRGGVYPRVCGGT